MFAVLCFLWTGYYAWALYDAHCKQVTEWNVQAKEAFQEALWEEVNKRAEIQVYHSSSGVKGMKTLNETIPDTVFVTSHLGRIGYRIERTRYDNSLIKDTYKRAHLSTLFSEYHPLSLDTLDMCWERFLLAKKIFVNSKIRYIKTELDLKNDTSYSKVDNQLRFDSLTVSYLGFRCEHELTAFVSYPHWLLALSAVNWFLGLLPWGMLCLLMVFYAQIERFIRNRFVKELVVEKVVHVADVSIDQAKFYQLPDGSLFDSFAGTITKGDLIHTLPPQSTRLLRLFICKENHRLTAAEIEIELWNGNGSIDKIHKVIQRLRTELRKVSSELVIKNVNGEYELK